MGWLKKREKIDNRWQIGALVAFIVMMVVNGLAGSTTKIGGLTTAQVSDSYPNLFAPAGLTFAIWGVIYALLGLFFFRVFEVWKPRKSTLSTTELNHMTALYTVSSLINAAWLLAWQYKLIWLSLLLMICLLVCLIKINEVTRKQAFGWKDYTITRLPFSIYLGWITIATIANVTTWLVSIGWDGWGMRDGTWMVAVLIVGAMIGITKAFHAHDWAFMAVFVWAYAGILLKHISPTGFDGHYPSTIITLSILLAVFLTVCIQLLRESVTEFKRISS